MTADHGMFNHIRVQILYPCSAKCSWCATHRKNPLFSELYKEGISKEVHDFYVQTIKRFQPQQVFISGGEPLLYPAIARFLHDIKDATRQINLFTSYQFSHKRRQRIAFAQMPLEKMLICHTTISFSPAEWQQMTAGFPFDLYIENIRAIAALPVRKRFKFIINHPYLEQEIRRFQALIQPDSSFEFGLKVINDQGGGLNESTIRQSSSFTTERIETLDRLLRDAGWGRMNYKIGSLEKMAPVLQSRDVAQCPYRQEPSELRFAFYRASQEKKILKYRYCPYFPADVGYRFHIGRDDPQKLARNYFHGDFRDRCQECRFLQYGQEEHQAEISPAEPQPQPIALDALEIYS